MKDSDCEETSGDECGDEEQNINNVIIDKATKGLKDKEVIPIAREWMAFMAHIPHADADEIRQDLERLETKYILGLEVSSYEHIHFLVLMTEREYTNIRKRLFIDKYKLRGRAVKGKPRQYGKEKEIRDLEKYTKYCLKDQKYLTNMEKDEIEEIIKMKIDDVKNTKSKNANSVMLKDELVLYVETHMANKPTYHSLAVYDEKWHAYNRLMKIKIVDFMRSKELSIRKSTIDMYFYHVVAYSKEIKMSSADIIDTLYQ
jgi:DNA-binding transcriptional regulator YhcF (GntR family)